MFESGNDEGSESRKEETNIPLERFDILCASLESMSQRSGRGSS
jgi:hypothetical protein